ncbi:MAG TPA: thrombospondin type 3 repeat-containing protein, partial [Verrucomicrobiae bacterium]
PANPFVFAVAQSNVVNGFTAVNEGVRVYEGTSARALASTNGANAVAFGASDSRLYEWNPNTSFVSSRLVTSAGVSNVLALSDYQFLTGGTSIQYSGNKVFPPSARAMDSESLATIGLLTYSVPFVPDANANRIVSAFPNVPGNVRLVVSDQTSFVPVASLDVTNVSLGSERILRCGSNIVAFATTNQQVVIVRSPLFHPSAPADLSVRARTVPAIVTTNDNIYHVVTISNGGPNSAQVMIGTRALPFSVLGLPSYFSSQTLAVGPLAAGQSTNFIYISLSNAPGVVKETFAVASTAAELNYADNVATQTVSVVAAAATATNVFAVAASAYDVAWNPAAGKLYVSSVSGSTNLHVIDPYTRAVTAEIGMDTTLYSVRLMPGGQRLQALAVNQNYFRTVDLIAQTSAPPRAVYGGNLYDMVGLPQDSEAFLAATSIGAELYLGGVRQTMVGTPQVESLAVLTNDNSVWGSHTYGITVAGTFVIRTDLARFTISSNGTAIASLVPTVPLWGRLHSFGGRLFDDRTGAVLAPASNHLFATFAFADGAFLADPATRRVFHVRWNGNGLGIAAFDMYTHEMLGAFSVAGPRTFPTSLATLWGEDGIAIGMGDRLLLIRTMLRNDADGDSLPDAWETQYLGGIAANPNADDDGDGASNIAEYYAGTNPSSAASVLRVAANQTGSDTLSFTAGAQRLYAVECSVSLPATNWFVVTNGVTGTGSTFSVTLPPPTNSTRFYRVRLSPPVP